MKMNFEPAMCKNCGKYLKSNMDIVWSDKCLEYFCSDECVEEYKKNSNISNFCVKKVSDKEKIEFSKKGIFGRGSV